jgi:MATE family multidrug resistance protein
MVGLVDTALMGHLASEKYLAAISIATSVMTMILWSFGFLRMSTVGLVAQLFGMKQFKEIFFTVMRNIIVAIGISTIIIFLKTPILQLIEISFNTSTSTQQLIEKYISIRIFSAPAELCIYVLIGFYLGIQKTKISSILITSYCILNILLSSIFVIVYDLEIYGVALGTLISAYITLFSFLVFSIYYLKDKFIFFSDFNKIFNKKKYLRLFDVNFDIFLRTVLLTFAFLWITYLGSKLGESYLAINAILLQFIIIASFFLDAYAFSTESLAGFTIGKKIKKNFLDLVTNSFQLSLFTSIIISLIYLLSFKYIINFLTDLDYLKYLAYSYVLWVIIIPPFASISYQFDGIFIGASQTAEMRNGMIISVLLFLISSDYLTSILGNHGIWLSLLFFMIMRGITLNYYFNNILKKF